MAGQETTINIEQFLAPDYLKMVGRVVANIIIEDDQFKAIELLRLFEEALSQKDTQLKITKETLGFYNGLLVKLKFIALQLLEDKEVISLLENNFTSQFQIADYNFLEKFNYKLLNTVLAEDRDNLKKNLLRVLLSNKEVIVSGGQIKRVSDWLKNYIGAVGIDGNDGLVKAQYTTSLKNNRDVSTAEYESLMTLFKFYDKLNIPSNSPAGLIEEPPVVINGQLYIFRQGALEPVVENNTVHKIFKLIVGKDKDTDTVVTKETAAPAETETSLTVKELEQALNNYSADSLEHKAIKQEINRLKVAAFKQAQKTNVKK